MNPPRELADNEYDADGWPKFPLFITPRRYVLFQGPCTCWLAEFQNLPGYYGEGATIEDALLKLRVSLGAWPHYQVAHKFRSSAKLERNVARAYKARAAAAITLGINWPHRKGGGQALDATAKELAVGKTAVNLARREMLEQLNPPAEEPKNENADAAEVVPENWTGC